MNTIVAQLKALQYREIQVQELHNGMKALIAKDNNDIRYTASYSISAELISISAFTITEYDNIVYSQSLPVSVTTKKDFS